MDLDEAIGSMALSRRCSRNVLCDLGPEHAGECRPGPSPWGPAELTALRAEHIHDEACYRAAEATAARHGGLARAELDAPRVVVERVSPMTPQGALYHALVKAGIEAQYPQVGDALAALPGKWALVDAGAVGAMAGTLLATLADWIDDEDGGTAA